MKVSMKSFGKSFWLVLAGSLATGCGDDTPPGGGACDGSQSNAKYCVHFSGSAWVPAEVEQSCGQGVTYTSSCPNENRVGTCTLLGGTVNERVIVYYTGFDENGYDASEAQSDCQNNNGSFSSHGLLIKARMK